MENNLIPTWYKIDHNKKMIDFKSSLDDNLSALDSAEIAINYIHQTYPKPYHVMVSGGVDSQAMLYTWKLFGKDYIPTTINYKGHNEHDLLELYEFSKKYQIDLEQHEFDVLDFYKTEYENYVYEYQLPSPQLTVFLAMTKHLQGTVIFTGNFLGKPCISKNTQIGLTLECNKRPFIPFFFWSSPDLAYSQLFYYKRNPVRDSQYLYSYDNKVKTYQNMGFPIIPQKQKYTGFEKFKDIYRDTHKHLLTKEFKLKNPPPFWSPYELALRIPYEKKVGSFFYKGILNDEFI